MSVAADTRPPGIESSPPVRALLTDSLSNITTSRSNGVNWPMVRLPDSRTITSSAP